MSFTTINARRRVAKGAALLDQKGPEGWRDLINLEHMRTWNFQRCVLGQIYGRYTVGLEALGLTLYPQGAEHGFDIGKGIRIRHEDLDKAWRELLS